MATLTLGNTGEKGNWTWVYGTAEKGKAGLIDPFYAFMLSAITGPKNIRDRQYLGELVAYIVIENLLEELGSYPDIVEIETEEDGIIAVVDIEKPPFSKPNNSDGSLPHD